MSSIPYYDSSHRLLAILSPAQAEQYIAQGIATAVRAKDGSIRRLYRRCADRVYGSIGEAVGAMHAGPSQTTRRMRYGDESRHAAPWVRDHKRPGRGWSVPVVQVSEGEECEPQS